MYINGLLTYTTPPKPIPSCSYSTIPFYLFYSPLLILRWMNRENSLPLVLSPSSSVAGDDDAQPTSPCMSSPPSDARSRRRPRDHQHEGLFTRSLQESFRLVPEQSGRVVSASGSRSSDPGSILPRGATLWTTPAVPCVESHVRLDSQAQLSSAPSHSSMT